MQRVVRSELAGHSLVPNARKQILLRVEVPEGTERGIRPFEIDVLDSDDDTACRDDATGEQMDRSIRANFAECTKHAACDFLHSTWSEVNAIK